MKIKIWEKLKLPKPYALPSRFFHNEPGEYTWEDWDIDMRKKYPVRYFLTETLRKFIKYDILNRFSDAWYWIRCHTFNRYHMLDLRQPSEIKEIVYSDYYSWGWIDEDKQMLFAMFNILIKHIEHRNKSKYHFHISAEGIEELRKHVGEQSPEEKNTGQLESFEEIYAIYKYWTEDRKKTLIKGSELLTNWSNLRKQEGEEERWKALKEHEEEFDTEEEAMLIRLIKVRKALWL